MASETHLQRNKETNKERVLSTDLAFEISRGNVDGFSSIRKFGENPSIQSAVDANVYEWGQTVGAEKYTFSADGVADIDKISSDDAADAGLEITIEGLDEDGNQVIQTIELNPTDARNPVSLTTPLWRLNRAYNANGVDLLGNVYIFVDGATTGGVPNDVTSVRGYISIGSGQTLQSVYTIPAGKTGYLMGYEASMTRGIAAANVSARFTGMSRLFGKVFRTQEVFTLLSNGDSTKSLKFSIPLRFPAKTDFSPMVDVNTNGVGFSFTLEIILVDDPVAG